MNLNYIAVVGYNWTGASIVVDLLKEFDDFEEFGSEFCLLWEKSGILDLELSLFNNWELLNQDAAIRDFIEYCKMIEKRGGKFTKWGVDINKKLDIDFMNESLKYVDSMTNLKYTSNEFLLDYRLSLLGQIVSRIKRKILKTFGEKNPSPIEVYFARPTKEEFVEYTNIFLNRLFVNFAKKRKVNNIILDQAFPSSNIQKSMRYFDNIKTIVVDRDPRDVYLNLIKRKMLIGLECSLKNEDSVKKFIEWFRLIRENKEESTKNILRLNFEDIVLDYENNIKVIVDFLGVNTKHSKKGKYVNPKISKKNIGLWKSYKNQDEINLIYSELKQYCYQG
jgi:hypothetical protein